MTDAPQTPPVEAAKPNFEIGAVIGNTFKIYTSGFPYFFACVFVPYVSISLLITFWPMMTGQAPAQTDFQTFGSGNSIMMDLLSLIPYWIGFALIQAVLVRSAVSVQLNRGYEFGPAVRAALAGLLPILLLGLVVSILVGIGILAVILPGLYVAAMFYIMIPVIVFENRGFAALGRSLELTLGYRWPLVGLLIIVIFIILLASFVLGIFTAIIGFGMVAGSGDMLALPTNPVFMLIMVLLDALLNALIYPISIISVAMAYLRLREIKEGGETQDLLKVFE